MAGISRQEIIKSFDEVIKEQIRHTRDKIEKEIREKVEKETEKIVSDVKRKFLAEIMQSLTVDAAFYMQQNTFTPELKLSVEFKRNND